MNKYQRNARKILDQIDQLNSKRDDEIHLSELLNAKGKFCQCLVQFPVDEEFGKIAADIFLRKEDGEKVRRFLLNLLIKRRKQNAK